MPDIYDRLIPPAHVLRRFTFIHPLHQRFLELPVDHPRRAAYNAEFWDDLVAAGLVEAESEAT